MKKNFFIVLGLIVVLLVGFFFWKQTNELKKDNTTDTSILDISTSYDGVVTIGAKTISVKLATTSAEQEKGLGSVTSLPEDAGMLFVFTTPDLYGFWMKDTLIPLDMIWLDQDMKIVHIEKNVLPETFPTVFKPESPALFVLEVNAGVAEKNNWQAGQKAVFNLQNTLQ